jgi:hypothetical protein
MPAVTKKKNQKHNKQLTPFFRSVLGLPSSSRFVSPCWWQIRPLVHGPDLLRGLNR